MNKKIKQQLDYLRNEIRNERISYSEIVLLESLKPYIDEDDTELMQWIASDKPTARKAK